MKRILKILCAAVFAVILIMSFAACAKSDVPDGYQLVVCEGDEFRLYVPTQWIANTSGGVASAYYTSDAEISVSAYKAKDANGAESVEDYWAVCEEKYKSELDGYSFISSKPIVFGGGAGRQYVFSAKLTRYSETDGKAVSVDYKFLQATALKGGDAYILLYSAPAEDFDSLLEIVGGNAQDEGIIPYFKFAEPYTSKDNDKKFDGKVTPPDGMKLASTNQRPYRLFVPESWVINKRTDATAAYASETDSSNVNVQIYMTSNTAETVSDHFAKLEATYKATFPSYELISDEEIKMDGISARKYSYSVMSGGENFKIVQAIVRKGDMFYYVTFTAAEENFEKHISDVNKMIENFDIR